MTASAVAENSSLRDQLQLMKIQLETANEEKKRHLEQNSNEKVSYEATIARLSQENRALKNQFDDTVQRFEEMEDRLRELTSHER